MGGVMVMPMGLDAAIKKRTSGEFKMEVSSESLNLQLTQGCIEDMRSSKKKLGKKTYFYSYNSFICFFLIFDGIFL